MYTYMVREPSTTELKPGGEIETEPKELAFEKLSFAQLEAALREVSELAKKTFQQRESGFQRADGEGIYIQKVEGGYRVLECTIPEFKNYIVGSSESVLYSPRPVRDKEVLMVAMKEMIEKFGNRVIE